MIKACEECGTPLNLHREGARYCSDACKMRAYRRRKRHAEALPEVMRSQDRWMRWKLVKRGSGQTKVPVRLNGRNASSTNAGTWTTFNKAYRSDVGDGIGFALGNGIGCYDLDDALEGGTLKGWAAECIAAISEPVIFAEVSQSGRGIHIFVEAMERPGRVIRDGRKIEFYSSGRFIAMTGNPYEHAWNLLASGDVRVRV